MHDDVEVDDGVVLDQLADLSDLQAFSAAISAHLEPSA